MVNVKDCAEQIRLGMGQPLWFISDGSASKINHGLVVSVELSKRGIRLNLDNGKTVSWRMNQATAEAVLTELGQTEEQPEFRCLPFIPVQRLADVCDIGLMITTAMTPFTNVSCSMAGVIPSTSSYDPVIASAVVFVREASR